MYPMKYRSKPTMKRSIAAVILTATIIFCDAGIASAFTVGVQDQGAAPATVGQVADQVGATTVRIIVTPGHPELAQVAAARAAGRQVQAAILVKPTTTAGDVRWLMRAWRGRVRTVSIGNEPELNGVQPCTYARLFRQGSAMIRREYPGTIVGFGEANPSGAMEYAAAVAACKGPRLRADFYGIHPYQFSSDPLAVSQDRAPGGVTYWGIGRLGQVKRILGGLRPRLATRTGRALPIQVTEFAYLTSGPHAITQQQAAWMWPRAMQQARRFAQRIVLYGFGPVHEQSNWGSAALLDGQGFPLASLVALAKATGRPMRWPARPVPWSGLLPSGVDVTPAVAPVMLEPLPTAVGASDEAPTSLPDPSALAHPPVDSEGTPDVLPAPDSVGNDPAAPAVTEEAA